MSEDVTDDARVRVVVSGVASVSHLVHVAAYLRALLESRPGADVTVAMLGIVPFLGVRRVSATDVAARLPHSPRLRVVDGRAATQHASAQVELIYVAVGAPGIKPWLRLRATSRGRLHVVVVDEGLGSYGDWRARWAASRRQRRGRRSPPGWLFLRAVTVALAQRHLTDERWALYRLAPAGWDVDPRVAAELRRGLATKAADACREAVLLSQPWVELGQLPAERYRAALAELVSACAAVGLALRIRLHPAEDRARYAGLPLDDGIGPAELDPRVIGAAVVLGFNSTALLNCAALQGMPSLRLQLPELAAVDAGMSPAQKSLFKQFVPWAVQVPDVAVALRALLGREPVL